jgi:hypothetical protein
MKVLLYLNGSNGTAELLHRAVVGVMSDCDAEICRTVVALSKRLRQRTGDLTVVVLLASTRQDLAEILALHDWLQDLRTILILPDRDSATISHGLTLRPRFFTFADADFSYVSAVLAKMLRVYGKKSEHIGL